MQTFLPYPDLAQSAKCLDSKRLGKQRVEVMQILRALRGETKGWVNHPATKMWCGYEGTLALYGMYCIQEWILRGYRNNMNVTPQGSFDLPPWFGKPDFHESHKSNLLRKNPEWYSKFRWNTPPDLPYVWPV